MSATLTRDQAYATVRAGWDLYRSTQQAPVPSRGAGKFLAARSELHRLTAPYANGDKGLGGADLGAIQAATEGLAAIVSGEGKAATA